MSICLIFFLLVCVDAVRCQCDGNHVDLQPAANGVFHYLQSPNYGNEHGKRTANCTWIINLPSPKHFLILYVQDLRLHYRDNQNNIQCAPSYDLRINAEKFGCDPDQFVSQERHRFSIQFRTPACAKCNNCVDRQIVDKVEITFRSSGERVQLGRVPIMNGFRIGYEMFSCPKTLKSRSTEWPFKIFATRRNSVGRTPTTTSSSQSSGISIARIDLSNEFSIGLSSASDALHEQQPTSITTNESHVEDDFNTKLSSTIDTHWIILASVIAGLLLILLVGFFLKTRRFISLRKLRGSRDREPASMNANEYDNVAPSPTTKISGPEESHQYATIRDGYENLQLVETPGYQTVRRGGSYIEVNPIGAERDDTKDSSGYEKIDLPKAQSFQGTLAHVKVSLDSEIATGEPIQKHLYDPVG